MCPWGKGVTPEGREFALKAQALSSKDYSSGLLGDYHSQTDLRLFGAVGLSMLSRAGDVLTEREALSEGTPPTPQSHHEECGPAGALQRLGNGRGQAGQGTAEPERLCDH